MLSHPLTFQNCGIPSERKIVVAVFEVRRHIVYSRHRGSRSSSSCRLNSPDTEIGIPAAVELPAADIEGNLHLVAHLVFLQVLDLVLSWNSRMNSCFDQAPLAEVPDCTFSLRTILPSSSNAIIRDYFFFASFSSSTGALPTFTRSMSKIRVELGSIWPIRRVPYARSAGT